MAKVYQKRDIQKLVLYKKIIGGILVASGAVTLLYFFLPLFLWEFYFSKALASSDIVSPIPRKLLVGSDATFPSLFSQGVSGLIVNYEDARNWYPYYEAGKSKDAISYKLSIPKLSIIDAEVSASDYNLSSHLVQYAGTAPAGDKGTTVILGHSTLPQLFKANDYKTIFARLHQLNTGDGFSINIHGISYTYKIFSILVTDASDTDVFKQVYDSSYVTLITCTPPGTVWKRLIVKAKLESVVN